MADINDIYSVKQFVEGFIGTIAPQLAINIFHYRVTFLQGTSPTDSEIAIAMEAFWAPKYKTLINASCTYRGVQVQRVFPTPLLAAVDSKLLQGFGTRVGTTVDILPGVVCGIVTKKTAGAGRAFRGRVYLPFPMEIDNEGGSPSAGYETILDVVATNLAVPITVGTPPNSIQMSMCIFRRLSPFLSPQVTTGQVRGYFANQRRRSKLYGPDQIPV